MARIPSAADISGPGSLRSGRGVARQDTTAAGRGLTAFGQGISDLGAGVQSFARQQREKQNALDIARAEVARNQAFTDITNAFERDPDYATYGDRAGPQLRSAVSQASQLIRDPEMRERWALGALDLAVSQTDNIRDSGTALQAQADLNSFEETLEANRRIYTDPSLPEDIRSRARADIEGSIAVAVETGLATPNQAQSWRDTYIDGADYTRAILEVQNDPDAIYGTSSGEPGEVVGVVSAGSGYTIVRLPDGTVERREGTRAWRNNNPGNIEYGPFAQSMGAVGSDGRFAVFPSYEAGREAKRALLFETASYRDRTIAGAISRYSPASDGNDTATYISRVAQAVGVPSDSPLSSLTEAQQRAMLDAMEQVEGFRPGTSSAQEGGSAAGAAPEWFNRLPPEQRAAVMAEANQARSQRNAETRAMIEMAAQNAPVAIMNTGQYAGYQPTEADFLAAYGPTEAPSRYRDYQTSITVANDALLMRNLSVGEVQAMVEAARPTSSGDNAAFEQERYETLATAAQQTIEAREADPAGYTLQHFPRVREAWEQALADPSQSYGPALSMMAAAQNQLGVTDPRLMPAAIADRAIQTWGNTTLPERDRVQAVTGLVLSTSDPDQQRAIFNQLVDAGLPEIAEGAVEAAARGDQAAANRLFLAALVNPADLPGRSAETPARIGEEIQSQLMGVGQVGDLYYGLSDGTAENFVRAERDAQLLQNAVEIRLRNGEGLSDAVRNAGRDLYGDVRAVDGGWFGPRARLLLPSDQDAAPILEGLSRIEPQVREAVASIAGLAAGLEGTERAVFDASVENYVQSVMDEGYFRNTRDGYVFIDPFVGAAVSDADGNPITWTEAQILSAAPSMTVQPPADLAEGH